MSSISCLSDLVGVSVDMCEDTPNARYYVNDLTGITVKKAGKAANEEDITGYKLIKRKIEQAQNDVITDVVGSIGVKVTGKALIANRYAGYLNNGAHVEQKKNGARGVIFRVCTDDYVELQINTVRVWSGEDAQGIELKIIDLLTGEEVKTVTTDLVEGINNVVMNVTIPCYARDNYFGVVYDSSEFDTYNTRFNASGCCPTFSHNCGHNVYVESAEWANVSNVRYSNKINTVGSHGMAIDYSLMCSGESFVCRNAQMFAAALQYRAAALVMMEMRFSTRLNGLTQTTKEGAEELGKYYNDVYTQRLNDALRGIGDSGSKCFSCRPKISKSILIP